MSWGIDDIDPCVAPCDADGGALYGYSSLSLLRHEIGHCVPRVYRALAKADQTRRAKTAKERMDIVGKAPAKMTGEIETDVDAG